MGILLVTVILISHKLSSQYSIRVGKEKLALNQYISSAAAENIRNIRQIKAFSLEEFKFKNFKNRLARITKINIRFGIIRNLPVSVTEVLIIVCLTVILIYLNYSSKISLPSIIPILGFFVAASQRLFSRLSALASQRMKILFTMPALKLVHQLAESEKEKEALDTGKPISQIKKGHHF